MADQKMFYSNSDDYTRAYYDSLLIEPRWIGSEVADTSVTYFGKRYESPIMVAPFPARFHASGVMGLACAAKDCGTLYWTPHPDAEGFRAEGIDFVAGGKPVGDHAELKRRVCEAADMGAHAYFTDIDHLFNARDGGWDKPFGIPCGPMTAEDLKELTSSCPIPIVLKGILSVQDAILCKEAGVGAIVLSHHHGIVKSAVPPVLALQRIREAVGSDMTVFVDCGIESGIDAFKALALGADGVLVARNLIPAFQESGREGAAKRLDELTTELKYYMDVTGSKDVKHIDPSCLVKKTY